MENTTIEDPGQCPNIFKEELASAVEGKPKYVDLVVEVAMDRKVVKFESYRMNFRAIAEYEKLNGPGNDLGDYELVNNNKRYTRRLRIINFGNKIKVSTKCPHDDVIFPHHKTDYDILDPRRR